MSDASGLISQSPLTLKWQTQTWHQWREGDHAISILNEKFKLETKNAQVALNWMILDNICLWVFGGCYQFEEKFVGWCQNFVECETEILKYCWYGTLELVSSKSVRWEIETEIGVTRHQDKQFPNNYLNFSDMMAILSCCRNTRHNLISFRVKHRCIIIDIIDVDPHNNFSFSRTIGTFALNIQGVEEKRNFLGGFGCWSLKNNKKCINQFLCFAIQSFILIGILC